MRAHRTSRTDFRACLFVILLLGALWATSYADSTPSSGSAPPSRLDAVLDSLRAATAASSRWDEFVTSADWDSTETAWIPDPSSAPTRNPMTRFHFDLSPRFRFNKVEGITPGTGATVQWARRPGFRIDGGMDRATAPGRWAGEVTASFQSDARSPSGPSTAVRTRHGGGGPESAENPFGEIRSRRNWRVFVSYAERALPFGSQRPVRNGFQAALLSVDTQSYSWREERTVGFEPPSPSRVRWEFAYTERKDRNAVVALDPLWNTDPASWKGAAIDRVETHGLVGRTTVRLGFLRSLEVTARAGAFGGAFGGDREFYPAGFELRRSFRPPGAERLTAELWGTAVFGRPPSQEWADLGGSSSLRAHRTREQLGRASTVVRLDYELGVDILRRIQFPFSRQLRLQPVLFVDTGAAWGGSDWTRRENVRGPRSADWRTDFGIGVQRRMGYPGLIDRLRVDFAFRTDRSNDRFLATVRLFP